MWHNNKVDCLLCICVLLFLLFLLLFVILVRNRFTRASHIICEGLATGEATTEWSFVDGRMVPRRIGKEACYVGPSSNNTKEISIPDNALDIVTNGFCTRWSHNQNSVDVFQIQVDEAKKRAVVTRLDASDGWKLDLWIFQRPFQTTRALKVGPSSNWLKQVAVPLDCIVRNGIYKSQAGTWAVEITVSEAYGLIANVKRLDRLSHWLLELEIPSVRFFTPSDLALLQMPLLQNDNFSIQDRLSYQWHVVLSTVPTITGDLLLKNIPNLEIFPVMTRPLIGLSMFEDRSALWIFLNPKLTPGTPGRRVRFGVSLPLQQVATTATVSVVVRSFAAVFVNGLFVGSIPETTDGSSAITRVPLSLRQGQNILHVDTYRDTGSPEMLLSLKRDGDRSAFLSSDSTWWYSIVPETRPGPNVRPGLLSVLAHPRPR